MSESAHIENEEMAEKGVSSVVFTISFFGIVIICLLIGGYVVVSDRINGLDAYRVREMREQRDGYKTVCEENYKTTSILHEWIKQQNLKPPPEFMVLKNCIQPAAIEQAKVEK